VAKKQSTGFAARLKALRESAGLTQAQLAERAGLHLHGVTKLEYGDREPSWPTVLALAAALGVSTETFVNTAPAEQAQEPLPRGRPRKAPPADQAAAGPPKKRKGKGK
jgi:transcriptional regulator with XRE-family HTH domain